MNLRLPAPFQWTGDLILAEAADGAEVFFTTRLGGVSDREFSSMNLGPWTGDEADNIVANRERLAERLGIPQDRFSFTKQVHGNGVLLIDGDPERGTTEADAQITTTRNSVLKIFVADCLPIVVKGRGMAAAIHCGWRSLAEGIIEKVAGAFSLQGADVFLGPSARGCCYEVGDEVHEALGQPATDGKIDLADIATAKLRVLGARNIFDTQLCTICSDASLFYSFRRDGPVTGRQAGGIFLV